jgi:putative endonuclease
MREHSTLIFVEVRKRASMAFGGARASIDHAKTSRIERAVNAYLAKLPARPAYRIDAVVFEGSQTPQWIKNALV